MEGFVYKIIVLLLSYAASRALAPDPPKPKPPSLDEFELPHTNQGQPVIKVFGNEMIRDPALLWYGDLSVGAIRKKGGKK